MASHLTIIPGASAAPAARALGAPAEAPTGDSFASLLGPEDATAIAAVQPEADAALANLLGLELGVAETEQPAEDPDAIAVPVDAILPIEARQQLTDLVNQLADLKERLQAGEAVTGKQLLEIDAAAEKLAETFGIEPGAVPELDKLRALFRTGDEMPLAQVAMPVADMVETLLNGDDLPPDLRPQAAALGDKLSALLAALAERSDLVEGAGLDTDDGDLDPALKAALARLGAVKEEAPPQPVLATPQLKLTPSSLTAPAETAPPAPVASSSIERAAPDTALREEDQSVARKDERPADSKADAKAPLPAAAQSADKATDFTVPTQPQQQARADAVALPRIVQTGYQTSQQQLNLPQLAFELVRQVNDGNSRFQIRLDPAELGRIDVRLDIDATGQVNARLTVEKAETLDLMQRDQRGLERALQQAGLDSGKTNLEFSLRQNPFGGGQGGGREGQGQQGYTPAAGSQPAEDTPPTVTLYRGSLSAGGVNIMV